MDSLQVRKGAREKLAFLADASARMGEGGRPPSPAAKSAISFLKLKKMLIILKCAKLFCEILIKTL